MWSRSMTTSGPHEIKAHVTAAQAEQVRAASIDFSSASEMSLLPIRAAGSGLQPINGL
jgi:hypothetical protein